ncbi:hypothetical protein EN943_13550 [Mesorhizobium sp. M7A.F.Ca.US.006.01.1.1]|nr:hypothetical protein EN943_13550 [Mesorhizobium sp. M7A.F.Ca.US.006.01.1.1]
MSRQAALSLCFYAIPEGKRYALFPGKPLHTFPGIALAHLVKQALAFQEVEQRLLQQGPIVA